MAGWTETVTGKELHVGQLGHTLMHEHIFVLDEELERNFPTGWDEQAEIEAARQNLAAAYDVGVGTIVDLTVLGLGRDVQRIRRVAQGLDINVVVATGLYTFDDLPSYFRNRGPGLMIDGPDPLADAFVRDLTVGVADTGIRAGLIKVATDIAGLTPGVKRVIRAAARAHRETGAPITTHTHAASQQGLAQIDVLRHEGVDLERVIIGHCGDSTDLNYLEALLSTGVILGLDRFGLDLHCPPDDRIQTLTELCSRGYADRIVLSHDSSIFTHTADGSYKERNLPNWHYRHIHLDVLPELSRRGVDDAQINTMLTRTPERLLLWR